MDERLKEIAAQLKAQDEALEASLEQARSDWRLATQEVPAEFTSRMAELDAEELPSRASASPFPQIFALRG